MNSVIYMGHAMPMKVSADYLSHRTNTRSFVGFSSYIPRTVADLGGGMGGMHPPSPA